MLVEFGALTAGPEAMHADENAVRADKAVPTHANGGFDRHLDRRVANHVSLVLGGLLGEQFPRRDGHDPGRMAVLLQHVFRVDRDLDLRAGREDRDRCVVRRGDLVGTASAAIVLVRLGAQCSQALARQHDHAWTVLGLQRELPAFRRFRGIGRTHHEQVRNSAQSGQMLHRLVSWAILTEPDRIVRHDVDHPDAHQRGQPDRALAVVREAQERPAVRNIAAMDRNAVHRGGHAVFPDAVVDVATLVAVLRRERRHVTRPRVHRAG